ncbi:flagellar hook-basal body complex protein [Selenomonas noxia]|uniref:flagellar hook-basal body complex protein n=1 Tax=Selenomonas noxia TaxID=135083 RepID=UPI0028800CB1|nr:flagellar hook-basal body complex protein [Selenomonas noxia]
MMRSMFSGVSGLKSHNTRMDVIGNNIANVNTTGFKASRVTFADMISQTLSGASAPNNTIGGTNPKQVGLGTSVSSIDLLFGDASVQSTGKNTDLAMTGNGLFVVNRGKERFYTRNGAFEFDADGNYVMPGSGLRVQGWMANNGVLNTNGSAGDIHLDRKVKELGAKATESATYTNNLDGATKTIVKLAGSSVMQTLTLSDGTTAQVPSTATWKANDVYSSTTQNYTTAGDTVNVSKNNSPVTVTFADGTTRTFSHTTAGSNYRYGYDLNTVTGGSATASTNTTVRAYSAGTPPISVEFNEGEYTIGGTATKRSHSGSVSVTGAAGEKVVLHLSDGTTHDVTAQSPRTYTVGTDTYTYPSGGGTATATVVGYEHTFTIDHMSVISKEGDGTSLRVGNGTGTIDAGEGYGIVPLATGQSATPSASSSVDLTLNDGTVIGNQTTGGPYSIGDSYTGPALTGSVTATASNPVLVTLADGTVHRDNTTGRTYTIGSNYTYTDAGGTPHTHPITGLNRMYTITGVDVKKEIQSVSSTKNVTVDSITPTETAEASRTNPLTVTLSDGTVTTVTSGKYQIGHSLPVTTLVTVYDTLGNKHSIPIFYTLTKTGTGATTADGNEWTVGLNGQDVTGTTTSIQEENGTTTTVTLTPITMKFSTSGELLEGGGTFKMTLSNGAFGTQDVTLDLTAVTQYAGTSTIVGKTDGYAAGTLSKVAFDSTGTLTGTYTNGVKQMLAQVAVAQFNNATGLEKQGSSLYQESNNSGEANIKTAATFGVTLTPGALEMSNVDIADQFSDMIITQRGFQSNSKIITVSDEMLETLINMKR